MRTKRIVGWRGVSLILILGFVPGQRGAVQASPIRIAYSAVSGAMAPLWVAQEGGYFKREGLDTELLYIGGGSLLIQSMISGEVSFAYGPSVPVINAALKGSDLVLIANTGNALVFSIMSRPDIRQPAQIRGKKVGVTRFGGSTDWALDAALKQWGLDRGREVVAVQTGGMPESLAALTAGALDAAVLSPPSNFRARKAGMNELVDVGQLGIAFPNTPLSATRSYLRSHRENALRFIRAFCAGLYRLRRDKEFSMRVLARYTRVRDAETLADLYQVYAVRYSGDLVPYVRAEGVGTILTKTAGKEARDSKAADFIDNGLLRELEQSGWFRSLR
ncbi:MAG TPA: ABC transporter substrate-binding protein [candidate division Zixibacteria bacterium]|nr:ABC transporter substrate-binding protein [candidate division Zixibacteria bacterium]